MDTAWIPRFSARPATRFSPPSPGPRSAWDFLCSNKRPRSWVGQCGLESRPGQGTRVWARLPWNHPDRPPLGDLGGTLLTLMVTSPGVEFVLELGDDQTAWTLSTVEVRGHIGDVPLTHPEVLAFLERAVDEQLKALGLKESA